MFAETRIISDGKFYAEIKRDEWGVPHIYGNRDSDVAFGLGYAHSQDDFRTIQDITIASRGKLSEYYGLNLWSIRNIKWTYYLVSETNNCSCWIKWAFQ